MTEAEIETLLPCPFCGCSVPTIANTGACWVVCQSCEAEGPPEDTEEAAADAWNARKSDLAPSLDLRKSTIEECARELESSYPDHAWLNAACAAIRGLSHASTPALPSRDRIAAFLLARDEEYSATPHLLAWADKLIQEKKDAAHSGDCTGESHTCHRCTADRALADADRVIAMALSHSSTDRATTDDAADAARYRYLKEHSSYYYAEGYNPPTPREFGIQWEHQDCTPDRPGMDWLIDQEIEAKRIEALEDAAEECSPLVSSPVHTRKGE